MPGESGFSSSSGKTKVAVITVYGEASSVVSYEVTQGNCKITLVSVSGSYGDVTLTYLLIDEREGTASMLPLWSTSENGTFSEMTKGTGGDNKTTLTTSDDGTQHTFVWDTVTDLGIDFKGKVYFKLRGFDRDNFIGDYNEVGATQINIDNAPEAPVITTPVSDYFDKDTTPQIIGTIPNPKAGNSDLHFKVEVATDENFNSIEQTYESRLDQTGWEYDSSGSGTWVPVPFTGVPVASTPALIGNSWRLTVQTERELIVGTKFIRAYAGGCGS